MGLWKADAAKIDADIKGLPASLGAKKADLEAKLAALPPEATAADKEKITKSIAGLPKTPEEAKEKWDCSPKSFSRQIQTDQAVSPAVCKA